MRMARIFAGAIISMFILTTFSGFVFASTTFSLASKTEANISGLASTLDATKAENLAEATSLFQSYNSGYTVVFNSIFNIWSFDSQGDVTWKTVNVVYTITNSTGFRANIVVTENPSTLQVLNTTLQTRLFTDSSSQGSTNWSGYTFYGNSGASTPVYEAEAVWTMPVVSEPQSYWCLLAHCDIVTWPGLTANSGGSTGIVQAGTDSGLYCTVGCSYYYYGWYEFFPAGSVTCSNSFSAGDSVGADIHNHAENGGSSTVYDVYVFDYTKGTTCSVTNQSFTSFTTPYYGQFITERPKLGGTPARLPKFGSVTMTGGWVYYGGGYNNIYTPYSNGWYIETLMNNGQGQNINVGPVLSTF